MAIGTNLRKLRRNTKYSQQDIADLLNIDRVTYTKWENENTDVKSQYIPKLAEIFDVEISELFNFERNNSFINNNFDNKDNSIGQKDIQQGVFINIADSEAAKLLGQQLKELLKSLNK